MSMHNKWFYGEISKTCVAYSNASLFECKLQSSDQFPWVGEQRAGFLISISHHYVSRVVRKPAFCICENKVADQLRGIRIFKPLAILCGCTARFVLDLVGNPEDRFSHNEAHVVSLLRLGAWDRHLIVTLPGSSI